MNHIFISYSHGDSALVDLLEKGLRRSGYDVWRDKERIRAGQALSREVGIAIDDSVAFISLITPHYSSSKWLDNELTRAINREILVVPVVFNGAKPPVLVEGLLQIRIDPLDGDALACEIFSLLDRINHSIGDAITDDESSCDSSSGEDDLTENDQLTDALTDTRWTWCQNGDYISDDKWIEFLPNGILRRSWRQKPTRWSISPNGFVLYAPHVLQFDIEDESFHGAVANPEDLNPTRSGRRLRN